MRDYDDITNCDILVGKVPDPNTNLRQIRQILNSTAIGGEKITKENQYLLLDDTNL